jgi:hypothetical protein
LDMAAVFDALAASGADGGSGGGTAGRVRVTVIDRA